MKTFRILVLLAVTASAADAQVCIGSPRLEVAPTNLSLMTNFVNDAKGVSGIFGFGNSSAFGGVGAGYATYTDARLNSVSFGGHIGAPVVLSTTSSVRL